MPRVILGEKQRKRDALAGVIAKYQTIYGLDNPSIATTVGFSRETYYRRRHDPDTFTIGELKKLAKVLRIPKDELLEAIM